jgi:imidazolonepropionase-like amidohydrolase
MVAHSVRDVAVDAELIGLLQERNVCYVPTLTREISTFVYAERPAFFDDPFFQRWADQEEVRRVTQPIFQEQMAASTSAARYREGLRMAQRNLKTLSDAGVPIAMGTDAGPAGRFPGYFEHVELDLMVEAGLTPAQALASATSVAARCLGLDDVGTLEPGNWADFLVLDADPLADVANTKRLRTVYVAGNEVR